MPPHGPAEVLQRSDVGLDHAPAGLLGPAGALPAPIAEDLARIGGEKGVAGPALAALERFEQEAVGPRCSLAKAVTGVSPSSTTCTGDRAPSRPRERVGEELSKLELTAARHQVAAGGGIAAWRLSEAGRSGGQQLDLIVRLESAYGQRPLECDVAAVNLRGPEAGPRNSGHSEGEPWLLVANGMLLVRSNP